MMSEEIIAYEDGIARVLEGAELETFLADRDAALKLQQILQVEIETKEAAKASALAKLSALGLTEDEVQSITGGN